VKISGSAIGGVSAAHEHLHSVLGEQGCFRRSFSLLHLASRSDVLSCWHLALDVFQPLACVEALWRRSHFSECEMSLAE
jgi:hypothetical protein